MNRKQLILAAVAAASISASFGQQIPAGYQVAYLPDGRPVLVAAQQSFASRPANRPPQTTQAVYSSPVMDPAPVIPARPSRIMLPAGLTVFVRTGQALHSNQVQPGQTFECYLDAPLYSNETMIADRGARVAARVVEADMAGRISGQSKLAVQIFQIQTLEGGVLNIHTTSASMSGGTSYGKDAARIATGTAVGALVGGLAGGGRGAAIGAGIGAGGGTVWTLKTRGPEVAIPSETQLQFQLVTPATLSSL